MSDCHKCGTGRMGTTHTKRRGGMLDRQRRCSVCGFVDRVLVQPEVVLKYLPVKVRKHTLASSTDGAGVLENNQRAETLPQKDRGQ